MPDSYYGQADYKPGSDYPVQADIPAQPAPSRTRRTGLIGGLLAVLGLAVGKLQYVFVLLKLGKFAATFISLGIFVLVLVHRFGWLIAAGFGALILIHESGHVVAARLMGIRASLPIFIPLLGAFVQTQPETAAQEAQVAIAGPILGSIASALCYVVYLLSPDGPTAQLFLALAYLGLFVNLFNLIPVTPLDGGRVLSLVSKWFNLVGLAIAVALVLFLPHVSPILWLIILFGGISTWQRFRSVSQQPAYYAVPAHTKWTIGALYLALLLSLGVGLVAVQGLIPQLAG
jgi:Zn-dependent protease